MHFFLEKKQQKIKQMLQNSNDINVCNLQTWFVWRRVCFKKVDDIYSCRMDGRYFEPPKMASCFRNNEQ